MAIENFIPEVWSSKILTQFRGRSVWAGLTNREYEGDLRVGNTVYIPGIVDVEIKDYKANNRTTEADAISDTGIDMVIDQEKNFDFYVDDIDRAQAGRSFDAYTQSATTGLVEDTDTFLASLAATNGTTVNGATVPTDAETAHGNLLNLRRALTDAKVPQANRVVVINAEFEQYLLGWDSKLTEADTSGSTDGLREATIGRLSGFNVIVDAHMPVTDRPQAIAFHLSAIGYASQINKIEALRADNKFADRIRGLHVYGGKVLRPSAVQVFTAV